MFKLKPLPTLEGPYRREDLETNPEIQNEDFFYNKHVSEAQDYLASESPVYPKTRQSYSQCSDHDSRLDADKTKSPSENSSVSFSSIISPPLEDQRSFSLQNKPSKFVCTRFG